MPRLPRPARLAIAAVVTVVVAAAALLLVDIAVRLGGSWAGVIITVGVVMLWLTQRWWILLAPDDVLTWLKNLPALWRWARREDTASTVHLPGPTPEHPVLSADEWPTRRW